MPNGSRTTHAPSTMPAEWSVPSEAIEAPSSLAHWGLADGKQELSAAAVPPQKMRGIWARECTSLLVCWR